MPRHIFALKEGMKDDASFLRVGKFLLLILMRVHGNDYTQYLFFLQHVYFTPPVGNVDALLPCIGLLWATNDEEDHTLAPLLSTRASKSISAGELVHF